MMAFAHAVLFVLDDRASYVTESVVTVDGGLSMEVDRT